MKISLHNKSKDIRLTRSGKKLLSQHSFYAMEIKYLHIIIFSILYLSGNFSFAQGSAPEFYCELKGSVYIAEYPAQADFLVYEEDSEAFADMLVFETDNSLFADRNGIWFFTDQEAFADFTVYFVESKNFSDFTIYFTSFESFAGCNH